MQKEEVIAMSYLHRLLCVLVVLAVPPCVSGTLLQVPSPDKKYQLFIVQKPSPESPDVVRTSFSIADAKGNVIGDLGATEFPVIAVKWHKDAKAVMVIEHISRQTVMRLIALNDKAWAMSEVSQFKETPNFFSLVNVESSESGFICFYLGRNDRNDASTAYRTELSIQSGDAKLLTAKRIEDEEFGFYKVSIGMELQRLKRDNKAGVVTFSPAVDDDEPNWVMPQSSK